jgi:hypothetical protein
MRLDRALGEGVEQRLLLQPLGELHLQLEAARPPRLGLDGPADGGLHLRLAPVEVLAGRRAVVAPGAAAVIDQPLLQRHAHPHRPRDPLEGMGHVGRLAVGLGRGHPHRQRLRHRHPQRRQLGELAIMAHGHLGGDGHEQNKNT